MDFLISNWESVIAILNSIGLLILQFKKESKSKF
jgi:hypothetical protein